MAGADLGFAPHRRVRGRRIDEIDQRANLRRLEFFSERRHLRRRQTVSDNTSGILLAQTPEVLRQQCRPDAAEARGAMTFGAVPGKQRGGVRLRGEREVP